MSQIQYRRSLNNDYFCTLLVNKINHPRMKYIRRLFHVMNAPQHTKTQCIRRSPVAEHVPTSLPPMVQRHQILDKIVVVQLLRSLLLLRASSRPRPPSRGDDSHEKYDASSVVRSCLNVPSTMPPRMHVVCRPRYCIPILILGRRCVHPESIPVWPDLTWMLL